MTEAAHVFISHKHDDKMIAEVVSDFIKDSTAGKVKVHNSSSTEFGGPGAGKNLTAELKKALAATDVVLLIYTSADVHWDYCMWECGVAVDPCDEHPTNIVVLRCGTDAPAPFADTLSIDLRSRDDVVKLTKQFLTDPEFFPTPREISGYSPEDPAVTKRGEELFDALQEVLPSASKGLDSDLTSATYLRIEIPQKPIEEIEALSADDRHQKVHQALIEATIVDSDRAKTLFGFNVDSSTAVGKVLDDWTSKNPDLEPRWFTSLAGQIDELIRGRYPQVPWAPYKIEGDIALIPLVSRSRRTASDAMQFDTYFIELGPAPIPVSARMIPISSAFHKRLDKTPADTINLIELRREMDENDERSRTPVLGEGATAQYMVHRSMIDRFVSDQAIAGGNVQELTLANILAEQDLGKLFSESFAVVGTSTNLADAKSAMTEINDAQDVLVTEDGTRESAVVGWLTNTMFV